MSQSVQTGCSLPESALKPALALALEIEHSPMGLLMLPNEHSGTLEPVVAEGLTEEQSRRFGAQRPGIGPIGMAYAQQRRVTIRDVLSESDGSQGALREIARAVGFRGLDVVPLTLDGGSVVGAVTALFRVARHPSARSARLSALCGRLMALALDHARLRADAERRREIVEAMARARVQLVAQLGHELRTPLQSITGYLELLRMDQRSSLTPNQKDMLDRVRNSERVLMQTIDDLATMARLEAGRLAYLIVAVVASQAIATAAAVIAPLAKQKKIRLLVEPAGKALVARADDMKLKQVLINLLANAVKFTPSGGSVRVACHEDDGMIVFQVCDTGPGIPQDKLQDVFEPHVQLSGPVSGVMGSGLGLAISQEFAHGMGGSLTASSMPGKGAQFTFCVPRA